MTHIPLNTVCHKSFRCFVCRYCNRLNSLVEMNENHNSRPRPKTKTKVEKLDGKIQKVVKYLKLCSMNIKNVASLHLASIQNYFSVVELNSNIVVLGCWFWSFCITPTAVHITWIQVDASECRNVMMCFGWCDRCHLRLLSLLWEKKTVSIRKAISWRCEALIKLMAGHQDAGGGISRASAPLVRHLGWGELQHGGTEQMVNVRRAHACHHHLH